MTRELVTYEPPEGEPWGMEYAFVTDLEWFEGDAEPTRLRRCRWVLVDDETGTYFPPAGLGEECAECSGHGWLGDEMMGGQCPACDGDGHLPAELRDEFVPDRQAVTP